MKKVILISFVFFFVLQFNSFAQFVSTGGPSAGQTNCLHVSGTYLYAGTQTGGVYVTSNNGNNWIQVTNGIGNITVNTITSVNNNIFAGTADGVFRSVNNGSNWIQLNYGETNPVTILKADGSNLYLGTMYGHLFMSSDNGNNWASFGNIISGIGTIYSILLNNGVIYVSGYVVAASSDNGASWHTETVYAPGVWTKTLYALGNTVRAGTSAGGFKNTTPLGGWVRELPWGNYILSFANAGTYILMGGSTGIFWSSDNGTTWHDPNTYFMIGSYVHCMAQNGDYIFAGSNSGVSRRPVSELVGLNNISSTVPDKFSLSQNYPNPFNPNTNIKFDLPKNAFVTLEVYTQLGQVVSTLVNSKLVAGSYSYNFDAGRLSSGIYFYKLTADNFTDTKKLILVK